MKVIAEDIQLITDQELREYESTGRKMDKPKVVSKVRATRAASTVPTSPANDINAKKLYVQIKDPDDHKALLRLKKACSGYTGDDDIVLVLGTEKKSAIKLPFKIDSSDELISELGKILGKNNVKLK